MASFELKGFVDGIAPRQREFISNVLVKEGFSGADVTVEPVGKVGDNYGADVRRIVAEKDGQTLKMIAKVAPTELQKRQPMNSDKLFSNEHVMYTEVLPRFTELEVAADIPVKERLKYAKCLGSLSEEPFEIILLEDLQVEGYVMMDKFQSLPDDAVRLVLKSLAAFHSLSYALKTQDPEAFNSFKNKLFSMWDMFLEIEDAVGHFGKIEHDISQVLTDKKYKNALKGRLSRIPEIMNKRYKEDRDSKYAIIQQGDTWTNNIMFKQTTHKVLSCCMVDYQISRASSPVADLGYMIFICTDYEMRYIYYNDWLDYYHSQLDKYLSYHGLKANFFYPRDQLDADMRRYGNVSLAQAVLVSSVILRESGDAERIKQIINEKGSDNAAENMAEAMKMTNVNMETMIRFKTKAEGIIDSHIEFGLV